jgi:glucokinase
MKQRLVGAVASAVRVRVLTVDVDMVVIGGGISSLGEPLLRQLRVTPPAFPAAAVGAALVGAVLSEAA